MSKGQQDFMELRPGKLDRSYTQVLNEFTITETYLDILNDGAAISLMIVLDRRHLSYWVSTFLPIMCLVAASEITLFIDDAHFEATIMVALTSNLVMYTLYSGIQSELPKDATLKLIDIWLLHGIIMPMIVFFVLVINELIKNKSKEKNLKMNEKKSKERIKETRSITGSWVPKLATDQEETVKGDRILMLARVIIPGLSVTFMLTFFAVGINGNTL